MQNGDCKEFHTFPTGFSCVADLMRSRYIVKEALGDAPSKAGCLQAGQTGSQAL